jgi:hypothetical protein
MKKTIATGLLIAALVVGDAQGAEAKKPGWGNWDPAPISMVGDRVRNKNSLRKWFRVTKKCMVTMDSPHPDEYESYWIVCPGGAVGRLKP